MAAIGNNTTTTFNTALPYGVAALGAGAVGAVLAFSAQTTAMAVMGIALALIGAYAFLGIVACGWTYAGDPKGFQENVGKAIVTAAGAGIAEIITTVAKAVLLDLIWGRKNSK